MKGSFRRDGVTWLCYAFLAFYSFFMNSMGPITPFLKSELGLSYTVAGLHYTAFALGVLGIGLAGEPVIARVGKRRSLWVAAFGLSLGAIPLIFGRYPWITIFACFAMGLLGSLTVIVVPATLSERHGENRAIALSESNVIASVVAASSPILLGASVRAFGDWRVALSIAALLPFAMLAFLRGTSDTKAQAAGGSGEKAKAPPLPRIFWAYWFGILLAVAAEFGMISWASDFLATAHGLDKASAVSSLGVFLAAMIAGRVAGSRLAGRASPHSLLSASIAIGLLGFCAFWLCEATPLALAGLFAAGLGISGLYPFFIALALGVAGQQSVRASAIALRASGVAIMCLPVLLGKIADAVGIQKAYAVLPFVFVVLAGIVVATMPGVRKARSR